MGVTTPEPTRSANHAPAGSTLNGRRLPRWAPIASAAVALVLAVGITQVGSILGLAWPVLWAIFFLAVQTGWSFTTEGRRHAVDRLATTLIYGCVILAVAPLLSVLYSVVSRGAATVLTDFPSFLTETMRNVSPRKPGGGVAQAIVGTLEQVTIAALVAVPLGILAAVYLVEYGRGRLAKTVSFFIDVMTGVPSIVAGLFIYTFWVLTAGFERSGFAASLALVILMIPVVVRTTEEMLKIVPNDLREAAYALGIPKWKTILRIVIPTALSGIITGVMLAVARVSGETAPLLLTVVLSQSMNWNPFAGPQAALPTFVWDQVSSGTDASINRAWGGALVLIILVVIFYTAARLLARLFAPKAH